MKPRAPQDSVAWWVTEAPAFRVRMGNGRAGPAPKLKSFIGRIKAMVREQSNSVRSRRAHGGRGGSAAARLAVRVSPQRVAVKSRIVNHRKYRSPKGAATALREHFDYLSRRSASQDGERGIAFDGDHELTRQELGVFRDGVVADRHHFRIMVSPEKGADLDLPSFAREFVKEMQTDLKTRLQWFGIAHYDTDNPHLHLFVRGKDASGEDLVISRDYISHGMRLQAMEVATRRLGPRRAEDIDRSRAQELKAERVTVLDRAIDAQRALRSDGLVSVLRAKDGTLSVERERIRMLARLQTLESLGLAREVSAGIWLPSSDLLPKLQALSIRGDIVKTLHARMTGKPWGLDPVLVSRSSLPPEPLIGRVRARGRVDEFRDEEYLLIDGQNGREFYLPLAGVAMDFKTDARVGMIVRIEARPTREGARAQLNVTGIAADLASQIRTNGVTFLDRLLAQDMPAQTVSALPRGFEADFAMALKGRAERLQAWGLASEEGGQMRVKAGFLDELYERELNAADDRLRPEFGELQRLSETHAFRGTVAGLEDLPSGPHAVVAGGGRYVLVPATGALTRAAGRTVTLSIGPSQSPLALEPYARGLKVDVQAMTRRRGLGGPS